VPSPIHQHQEQVLWGQLGANAHGEVLEAGRVPDCYLGLLLEPAEDAEGAGVLVVAPQGAAASGRAAAGRHRAVRAADRPPGPDAGQLVFLADLTVELRAWPADTWTKVGVDPQAAAGALVAGWHGEHLEGLRLDGLTAEEALALQWPAMTYVRAELADRLHRRIGRADRRWRSLASGRRPDGRFLERRTPLPPRVPLAVGHPLRALASGAWVTARVRWPQRTTRPWTASPSGR
jgi:hypothetical protein